MPWLRAAHRILLEGLWVGVGLDNDAVEWDAWDGRLQLGQAQQRLGQRDVEAQVENALGEAGATLEVVPRATDLGGALLGEQPQRVLVGFAGVDHER